MNHEPLLTYHRFTDKAEAAEFVRLLEENHIEGLLDEAAVFNAASGSGLHEYHVKVRGSDFTKADEVQDRMFGDMISGADKDHYLYGFTDKDLGDILVKRDEWSRFDFLLARKILGERGADTASLEEKREERLEELAKPEHRKYAMVFVGYVLAFTGGLIGIIIGWHLLSSRKTLPDGRQVYSYDEHDRKHGSRIVVIGSVFLTAGVLLRIIILLGGTQP